MLGPMCGARVDASEAAEGIVQLERVDARACDFDRRAESVGEGNPPTVASALLSAPSPRVIDQDLPHCSGGDGEEVPTVLDLARIAAEQLDVSLVHDRRRLQGMAADARTELVAGEGAQLVVEQRDQVFKGRVITLLPALEQTGDVSWRHHSTGHYELALASRHRGAQDLSRTSAETLARTARQARGPPFLLPRCSAFGSP